MFQFPPKEMKTHRGCQCATKHEPSAARPLLRCRSVEFDSSSLGVLLSRQSKRPSLASLPSSLWDAFFLDNFSLDDFFLDNFSFGSFLLDDFLLLVRLVGILSTTASASGDVASVTPELPSEDPTRLAFDPDFVRFMSLESAFDSLCLAPSVEDFDRTLDLSCSMTSMFLAALPDVLREDFVPFRDLIPTTVSLFLSSSTFTFSDEIPCVSEPESGSVGKSADTFRRPSLGFLLRMLRVSLLHTVSI